ncbi:MAG: hypothetical protein HHJ16_10790 [Polaromonas sp.]|uniref:hypothetical protein n=1 Tax=Polaromonas sp. TaxID=1869339 RepID=UPI0017987D70|nr:hypothetical protein [Polaromonas sp.]NMM10750.1 hypothetical protein [Polaromonas sp.]
MFKIAAFVFVALFTGCASLDSSPPKYVFEAWSKSGVKPTEVRKDMESCGYKNTTLANDLNESEVVSAERCMQNKAYSLDTSSYRPNNCYGQNSPYLCNRLWGGKKPQLVPVRPGSQ